MPTDYTSHRFPTNFIRKDEGVIQNGSLALANTAHAIAENQHWNILADVPYINFYLTGGTGSVATSAKTQVVTVRVPPFAQWASFHFMYVHDFDSSGTASTSQYISVASGVDSALASNLPYGEDLDDTAKPAMTPDASGWVHFEGIPNVLTTTAPRALKLVTTAVASWQTVSVTVDISNNIGVLSGAYRVLPNIAALDMDV